MVPLSGFRRSPVLPLLSIGLGLGLLATLLAWVFPDDMAAMFNDLRWPLAMFPVGVMLLLTSYFMVQRGQTDKIPGSLLFLSIMAATALVYLFPELFAPGCNGMPRAFAATCPNSCKITTCSDWAAPGERGCTATAPDKGCCFAYTTTCDPNCSEPDPDSPPSVSGVINCTDVGTNTWCQAGATVKMTASDPQGYTTTISGNINGTAFTCTAGSTCIRTLPIGSGTVQFKATSASSGMASGVSSLAFKYDPTLPTAVLDITGTAGLNGWYRNATAVTDGTDATSGISSTQVSVNGGAWVVSAVIPAGTHSVVGRSVDKAGNIRSTAAQTVNVDATAPTLSATITVGTLRSGWYVSNVTVDATASDAASGIASIEYSLNNGAWTVGDILTVSTNGVHNLRFRATDKSGLTTISTTTFQIDKTAPTITLTPTGTLGANGWYTTTVTLSIAAADANSGVAATEYSLNGGAWVAGTGLVVPNGNHTIDTRSTDVAGNVSSKSIAINVDTVAPTLSMTLSGTLGLGSWYVSNVIATATYADATSSVALVEVRLDAAAWVAANTLTVSTVGAHTLDFRVTDQAGLATTVSGSFKLDKSGPVITVSTSGTTGTNGWYTSDATVLITAVDAVSGDSSLLYRLNAGSWVTGSNLSLTDGVHVLDVRATDIAGNLSTKSVTVKVDTEAPTLNTAVSGTAGQNGWYVGDVTVTATASDLTSGIAMTEYRLNSGGWTSGSAQTVASEGAHTVEFRVTDQAGLSTSASRSFQLDKTGPTITFSPVGRLGENGWYITPVTLTITATDPISGVETLQYQLDNGSWVSGSVLTLVDGDHTVKARSTDHAGNLTNLTDPTITHIQVDTNAPDLDILLSGTIGQNNWYVTDVIANAIVSDASSGIALVQHRLDDEDWMTGSSLTINTEGEHTIVFRSFDQAGLSTIASKDFMIDKTAPEITFVADGTLGDANWYISPVTLSLITQDNMSGVELLEYNLDDSAWTAGTSLRLADGAHTILARAVDRAGNLRLVSDPLLTNIFVDTTPPDLEIELDGTTGTGGWFVSDVTITATTSDKTSSIADVQYRLDGSDWLSGESLTVSNEGLHQIEFAVLDKAGLLTTGSKDFMIDKTSPDVSISASGIQGNNGWYVSQAEVTISAIDDISGVAFIEYRLEGGDWVTADRLVLKDGEHTLEARATDKAGNVSSGISRKFMVDTTPPELSIELAGTPGLLDWFVSDVTVTAILSDPTSQVASCEYQLDKGEWAAGASLTVKADGPHVVSFRVTDQAGNLRIGLREFKIDQTKPFSVFVFPAEGSSATVAVGSFGMDGQSTDETSGLAQVFISIDQGITWLEVPVSEDGSWFHSWDTNPFPNGLYPVLARAIDRAGNQEHTAYITVLLANHPPIVKIQNSWWIWETGWLKVEQRFIPIAEIRLRIGCLDGQPDVTLKFDPNQPPSELKWDRKCGQGQFATSGDHPVRLSACDLLSNCASAEGVIRVPFIAPSVPTWTPTPQATATPRATPTAWLPQVTRIVIPAGDIPRVVRQEVPADEYRLPGWFWYIGALLAFLLALASASLLDPRPAALRRLRKSMAEIASSELPSRKIQF